MLKRNESSEPELSDDDSIFIKKRNLVDESKLFHFPVKKELFQFKSSFNSSMLHYNNLNLYRQNNFSKLASVLTKREKNDLESFYADRTASDVRCSFANKLFKNPKDSLSRLKSNHKAQKSISSSIKVREQIVRDNYNSQVARDLMLRSKAHFTTKQLNDSNKDNLLRLKRHSIIDQTSKYLKSNCFSVCQRQLY